MIIRTKTKDFYDHFQHIYGQDGNIVWDRDVVTRDEGWLVFPDSAPSKGISQPPRSIFGASVDLGKFGLPDSMPDVPDAVSRFRFPFVSVLGNLSVLDHGGKFITEEVVKDAWEREYAGRFSVPFWAKPPWKGVLDFQSAENPEILKIHRKLNAPILRLHASPHKNIWVDNRIPILSEIPGFVKKAGDPSVFYQRLYNFFIENRDNSDLEPPVALDNKSKLEKAGFDPKISFRHPVK